MNFKNIEKLNKRQFEKVLEKEGQIIKDYYTGQEYKVFFRRTERSQSPTSSLRLYYSQDTGIETGTTIVVNGEPYIVFSQDAGDSYIYYTSIANKCDNKMTIRYNNHYVDIPITLSKDKYGVHHSTISETTGNVIIIAGDNDYTRSIRANACFNLYFNWYQVQNRLVNSGVHYLFMEQKLFPSQSETIEYLGRTTFLLGTDPYQMECAVCCDGVILEDQPPITYTSSDTSIATVDSNGVLTVISEGSVTISFDARGKLATSSYHATGSVELLVTQSSHRFEITSQTASADDTKWVSYDDGKTSARNRAIFTLHSYDIESGVEDTTEYLINEPHDLRFYVASEHESDVVWKEFESDGPNVRRGYLVHVNTIAHWAGTPLNVYAELDGHTVTFITMTARRFP